MRGAPILIAVIGALSLSGLAEADPIERIRGYYNRVTTEIARCDARAGSKRLAESGDCGLYLVEVVDNALHRPVAAVGISQSRARYWYDPSGFTGHASARAGGGHGPLVRAELSGQRAAVEWLEEYVYQAGSLVFYFKKSDFGAFRFYFQAGELVDFVPADGPAGSDDPSYVMERSDWPEVLRRSRCYQKHVPGDACTESRPAPTEDFGSRHLCALGADAAVPEELRIREADLTNEAAWSSLEFLDTQVLGKLARADGEAEIPWETLNIGVPNALRTIRGALLRARALALAEERRQHPERLPESVVRAAVDAYCRLLRESALVD
ncbi:hypothetical protein [Thiorhodococcus minor]|uniref:YARHG domain-containing protein n=1 Tax=Thiorhodococcus minor TaxID=57489 RepID=A0A6M0JZA2_9GAMM|nr:hypothetical protein [Thiorhodococcus minor]NEV61445.1 hypothetical protein [Thiorhodococcus minor]